MALLSAINTTSSDRDVRTVVTAMFHEFSDDEYIGPTIDAIFLDMPDPVDAVEVHTRIVGGNNYICGIGWKSASGKTFLGRKS